MRVIDPLRLYPSSWRARYGEEMSALLEDRPPTKRDRVDLLRGAIDAWLHPPVPSLVPPVAALFGGGLWTMLATIVVLQPVPADWPGYLLEVVPIAIVAVAFLLVAVLGCALRLGDLGGRPSIVAGTVAAIGCLGWIVALLGIVTGIVDAPALAAAQTVAMVGTAGVGILLVRSGDEPIGVLVVVATLPMIVPSSLGWLAFGTVWTAIGLTALVQRSARIGPAGFVG